METTITDKIADALLVSGRRLVTAESCTGGLIAATLTDIPGSSAWFEGAFVTYRNSAKIRMLGVESDLIERYTAVSEPVAREMSIGALKQATADISVAVTGIAGPDGGDIVSPTGTVWFAWALAAPTPACIEVGKYQLDGDRAAVRQQAVSIALQGVLSVLVQ